MKKLLAPFDREFKKVLETINMQGSLVTIILKKSSIERNSCSNRSQIQLSGSKQQLTAETELWQQES